MKNIFINCIEWFKNIFRKKRRRVSNISLDEYDDKYNDEYDDEYNDEYNYNLL